MSMSEDVKTRGKATIEVLSNPLGKSGSSFVLQLFILMFGTLSASIPYISLMFLTICVVWIIVVNDMGKHVVSSPTGEH